MLKFYVCFLLTLSPCLANIGPNGFHEFKQNVFVETGSYTGKGIQLALEAGFQEVHSLEISPAYCSRCRRKFRQYPNVHIYQLDSGKDLWSVIETITEPAAFWLDGHNGTPDPLGGKNTPLLEELEQIKWHPIKEHIILIDDLHCCGTILFDYLSLEDIIEKVMEINPQYTIRFVDGGDHGEYPDNVLVAELKEGYDD